MSAQIRQSTPDSGLDLSHFPSKVFETIQAVPSSLGSGHPNIEEFPAESGPLGIHPRVESHCGHPTWVCIPRVTFQTGLYPQRSRVSGFGRRKGCISGGGSETAVERIWHTQNSQGQILVLAVRIKSLKRYRVSPLRSEERTLRSED
jgi:hypothetical protein